MLADGDGEAVIVAAADGDDVAGVEAAVGAHGELACGPGVAYPADGLPQEVCRAPSRVGSAFAQPGHQHVACLRGNSQQRVIAPLAGVVVALRSLLCQSVGLTDGGVEVDRQWLVTGSCPRRTRHEPEVPCSHGPAVAHVPSESCAGTSPAWMEP